MKLIRTLGATSQILQVWIADTSSTAGAGLTGLVFNTSGLTAYYHRDTDTTATAISLVTMTVGTFTSSGFKEIDATNMPGWYQFCPPNAALASGAASVSFHLKGAANMAPLPVEIDLAAGVENSVWNAVRASHTTVGTYGGDIVTPPTNFSSLAINATGGVAPDWSAVQNPTTTVGLTGTTISSAQVAASVTAAVAITSNIKKNTGSNGFTFPMTDATTHALKTGLTVTGQVSLDGGVFGSLANAVSEIGTTGIYKVNLAAADVNGNHAMLLFTASGADDRPIEIITQP